MCVQVRSGIEIWIEADRAEQLITILSLPNPPQFLKYEGRILNRADIVGVFTPQDMEIISRRKNGEWKDQKGEWHQKGEKVCRCGNTVPDGMKCGFCTI